MTRRYSRATAASFVVWITACTHDAPPAAPAAPLAATAVVPRVAVINGTYNGLMQLASGSSEGCGNGDVFTVVVRNDAFRFVLNQPQVPWQPQRVFMATIAPDGSFYSGTGAAYIRGTTNQGHMQGQIVGDACQFQFEADSDGTF